MPTHRPPHSRRHPLAQQQLSDLRNGLIGRREFLSRVTALGLSGAAALRMAGQPGPASAQTAPQTDAPQTAPQTDAAPQPRKGGTVRLQCDLRPQKDPRLYDWTQQAWVTQGTLEYLVEYNNDGSFRGMLLEDWQVNENATEFTLHLRPGISWSNGDAFTAEDVVRNITRWCDSSVEGNSMAPRMAALMDDSGALPAGAITVLDPLTLRLTTRRPDITLIPSMADYPAAIVHAGFNPAAPLADWVGTGPMTVTALEPGVKAVLEKSGHPWWGETALPGGGWHIDRLELLDLGQDPASWVSAAQAGTVDALYESVGNFIEVMDNTGWRQSRAETGATIVIRTHQKTPGAPFGDRRVRRALAMAVDNHICLELGHGGRGSVADNCHVGPVHPEHDAAILRLPFDPARARDLLAEVGVAEARFELVSVDDEWRRNTADAVAAQLRDAGLTVDRRLVSGSDFANDWAKYPFSTTNWSHRPLGTQVLTLAYRSDAPWNETGFADATFDALLAQANATPDATARRALMGQLQTILIDEGVVIQPYWRALYSHYAPHLHGAEVHVSQLPQVYKWWVSG